MLTRVLKVTAAVLFSVLLLGFAAVMILTRTDWGRERVRRFVVRQLEGIVEGQVTVGRIRGNIINGATVEAVAISDTAGRPFIAAERISARYSILQLLTRKIDLRSVHIVRPVVVLDRPPGGKWNYQRIFPPSDTTKPRSVRRKGFPWIVLHDVTIVSGHLVMRTPWKTDTTLSRAAQDSSIAEALGGRRRLLVIRSGNGFQKVVELRDLTARLPLLRITQPGFHDRLAQVATLSTVALPFRPPAAIVNDVAGNVRFNNDSVWWSNVAVRMPGSRVRGGGRYVFSGGDLTVNASAKPGASADFRWVFPRLPSEGGGPLEFRMEWRGATEEYWIRDADLRSQGARLRGKFAISFADTFAIHDTDVRFSNLNTKLIEQVVPDFRSPRRGTLDGQVAILGGRNAMRVGGDVAFRDAQTGTSRVSGSGFLGLVDGDFRMRDLRVRVNPLQVALLKAMNASVASSMGPIAGTIVGNLTINGSTRTQLAIAGDAVHRDRSMSRLAGRASVRLAGPSTFNVQVQARPLSLTELGRLAPSLGLHGGVTGPIHLRGPLSDLRIATSLRLPDGGSVSANGSLDLEGGGKSYDLAASMQEMNLRSVSSRAPRTSLTANARARGNGFDLATMSGSLAADVAPSSWDSLRVDSGAVRVVMSNGLATVRRLTVMASSTRIDAAGTFGLAANRTGQLRYTVAIDSLEAYNQIIPGGEQPGVVRPRSAIVARAIARAREDSIRIARETLVERTATGRAMPRVPVDTPSAVARNALSGRVYGAGVMRGNVKNFDLRGRLAADDLVARGHSAKRLRAEYAWTNVRTGASRIALGVEGSQLTVSGFAFDTLEGRLSYSRPNGDIQLAIRQGDDRDYSVRGSFVVGPRRQVRVQEMALRADTTIWRLTRPTLVQWHTGGVEVNDVDLRSNTGGHIRADGTLPREAGGNANLVVDVASFQIADVANFLQSDLQLRGILTARGRLWGTLRDPMFQGAAGLVHGNYDGSVIPDFRTTFSYADASLRARIEAIPGGRLPTLVADASMQVDLSFTGRTGPGLLDAPLRLDLSGDSLPIGLIAGFTDAVEEVRGRAVGSIALRGTLRRPSLSGNLRWTDGSIRIAETGMLIEGINASARMARDTIFVDSATGRSGGGPLSVAGRMFVGEWRAPTFDLHLVGTNAEILRNDHGRLRADIGLSLTGPWNNAYVAGQVHVREGVAYVPEPTGKQLVNTGDPTVFVVLDTSLLNDTELFPASSPLLRYMRIDVDVTVNRNTWLRSRDMNIEIFTEEPLRVSRAAEALALTGVISTDRGEYTFLSRRFDIKRGSATFVGGPELNPALQATGEHEVALAGRQNFNIRVVIGGTMRAPKLTLESDAQPPISQSDLLSYLAFGRNASSLLQVEGSSTLTGATATGNLIGTGAALAIRRMAAVALGVMADEVEGEASKGLGADVFNITPADVPTELGSRNFIDFVTGTRIEAGKYFSPYFFAALQAQKYPGIRAQYRTPKGWRFEGAIEPRFLLNPPSLTIQPVPAVTSFGFFVIREWRW